jgi:hypothetical protein
MDLILDFPARTLIRVGDQAREERLIIGGNKARLIEAVVRLSDGLGASRQAVGQALWPSVDSWRQSVSLKVELSQLRSLVAHRGWTPLLVWDCGVGGKALHSGLLRLSVPIAVRNAGTPPLLVPGALRLPLLTLLLSHPDQAAVDRLLDKMVV